MRKENYKIKIPKIIYIIPIIFDLALLLLQVIVGKNYINSNMFKPLNLCCFISMIGYYFGKYCDHSIVVKIVKCFIFSSFIIGISIFNNTFRGADWKNASGYLYTAKNSAAMIFNCNYYGVNIFKRFEKSHSNSVNNFFINSYNNVKESSNDCLFIICNIVYYNFLCKKTNVKNYFNNYFY